MIKKSIIFSFCLFLISCGSENKIEDAYTEDLSTLKTTSSGQVIGFKHKNNSLAWFGIPYAEPPVDELRWRSPVPKKSEKEIKHNELISDFVGFEKIIEKYL